MKKILSVLVLIILLTPPLFAGIPIEDIPAKRLVKPEILEVKIKKKAKWKQKISNRIISKKAEIGESKVAAIVFSILIPFVGVAIFQDEITKDFWITLLLTAMLWVPGVIYALSIVLKRY